MERSAEARNRTITWRDPLEAAERNRARRGIDIVRSAAAGTAPEAPMWRTLGFELAEAERGRVAFTCTPAEFHYGPFGRVDDALALTMIDSAAGRAVNSMLPAGRRAATVRLEIDFVEPINEATGPIRCEGACDHLGRRIAAGGCTIRREADGALLARGRAIFAITDA